MGVFQYGHFPHYNWTLNNFSNIEKYNWQGLSLKNIFIKKCFCSLMIMSGNWPQSIFSDILLNFRTTFVNQRGEVVTNSKDIAINYLKTWFFLDLVAALPFDFLDLFQLNQNLNLVNKIFTFLLFQLQSILNTEFLIN